MARASYSATPLVRSLVHRPQGVILVCINSSFERDAAELTFVVIISMSTLFGYDVNTFNHFKECISKPHFVMILPIKIANIFKLGIMMTVLSSHLPRFNIYFFIGSNCVKCIY